MITTTITQTPVGDIATRIAERAERGYQLYLTRRTMITHEGGDVYTVPSCAGDSTYTVHYGGTTESCTCTDYGVHRGELSCKHLVAVAVAHATRRSGVREIRTTLVAGGDPFKAASRRAYVDNECARSCHCVGGYHYIGYAAVDDDGEEVEAFHAYPCRRCSS